MRRRAFALLVVTTALQLNGCKGSTTLANHDGSADAVHAGDGAGTLGDGAGTLGDGAGTLGDGAITTGDAITPLIDARAATDIWAVTNQPACNGTVYACSDGEDNDGDGLRDAQDPECVGPCDNDEGSFQTGLPGDNMDSCKQDCFFDGNSGSGDDKCDWNLKCDEESPGANLKPPCPYDPGYKNCPATQTQLCRDKCLPFAPNGCDCYGCCEVYHEGQAHLIYLGSPNPDCTVNALENCETCTQVTDCLNECDECELCLGKAFADLPATCFATGTNDAGVAVDAGTTPPTCRPDLLPECDYGLQRCCTHDDCPSPAYCNQGCCTIGLE